MTKSQRRLLAALALLSSFFELPAYADKSAELTALLLREGFSDPARIITKHPRVLEIPLKEVQLKIDWLRSLGVTHLDRVLSTLPSALNYSLEKNLKPKVALLQQAGFKNIGQLIERFAPILGLDLEFNVLPKLKLLLEVWQFPFSYIETAPVLLGMSYSRTKDLSELLVTLQFPFAALKSPEKRLLLQKWSSQDVFFYLFQRKLFPRYITRIEELSRTEVLSARWQITQNPEQVLQMHKNRPICAQALNSSPPEDL